MVGSFGKENMDLVEKSIGETALVKFVLYGQIAAIAGRLCEASPFNYVSLDGIKIFVVADGRDISPGKQIVRMKNVAEIPKNAGKIKIPFAGNNSAIRKINAVKIEEREISEKIERGEEKTKRERRVALLVSKIEKKQGLNEEDEILLKSITENKKIFVLEERTLYYNPWVPDYYCLLKSIEQIQKFKEALWGEEIAKSGMEEKEAEDKFTKFWYE